MKKKIEQAKKLADKIATAQEFSEQKFERMQQLDYVRYEEKR